MPQQPPPPPHGIPHPGAPHSGPPYPEAGQLAEELARMNMNPHPPQHAFPTHDRTLSSRMLLGVVLTKAKIPGGVESWGTVHKQDLPYTDEQLGECINKEKKKGVSAIRVYESEAMNGNKRTQVDRLLRDMKRRDPGHDYELASLRLTFGKNSSRQKVTDSMRVILKRTRAANDLRTGFQGGNSEIVDLNDEPQGQPYFAIPSNHVAPPPLGYDQGERIAPDRRGVSIPQHDPFPPQPARFTPPPPEHFNPPQGPENDRRFQEPPHGPMLHHHEQGNIPDRSAGFHGGPPGPQASQTRKDGKANAGHQTPKNQHAYPDPPESDHSDGSLSDDSVFSKTGTNRTRDSEYSNHRGEKRYSAGQRDGYRSAHHSRERDHDDYERGNHRDHAPRRRDSQRSSRGNHDFSSIRQHRRKSPLRSSNSSPSGGARYVWDEKMYATNGRRGRRGSEYSLEERPALHSRNDSYEEARPQRKPGMYPAKRMSGMSNYIRPVEIFDQRDEFTETVRAEVKQEVKQVLEKERMEELKRENERLKGERYRTEPMINEQERYSRAPMSTDLPRSRRFEADLQSNRYPYGY
ncbi:hypothetical protein MMC22_011989 [Lobaria immixta]|nr:hypothetical protein [Lobaria immixta]